jgi:beta-N-acetylhexosaminidase
MIATIKHFPGHGDTDVDSHLGLPVIPFDRARLNQVELVPFERGIEEGAGAVMAAHVELPSLDPAVSTPATFSRPVLHDLLRRELRFDGLLYTDSMSVDAITKMLPPDEAAVRAVRAGADQVLHSPDPVAAFNGVKAAVTSGRISEGRLTEALDRTLRAKASLALHQQRAVDLDAIPGKVGGRAHQAVAQEASTRSVTLVRDERHYVPLTVPRETPVLYLSVVDYPSGWLIAAPSRTFIPELRKRYPQVTSIEVSDRTTLSELDVVRVLVPRYGVVLASVFVRTTSGSGRLDLSPELVRLLRDMSRSAGRTNTPFVATFFGNPHVAAAVPEAPAVLLTYDFYDMAEASAVRAITGEAHINGRLPIVLPGMFPSATELTGRVRLQPDGLTLDD